MMGFRSLHGSQLLSGPGIPGVKSMDHGVRPTKTFADLTDVTLANEDNNSISTDYANRSSVH